jgi:multidrug efflux pump
MFITDIAIKRPVFSLALNIMIIIIGLLSYMNLSLQQYPDVEEPIIMVETAYPGAASSIVESKVTTRLEDALSGISGLDYMESTSKIGQSTITLFFKGGVSLSDAAADTRERIAQVRDSLPEDSKDPKVKKGQSNIDAFMTLVLTSPKYDDLELYDFTVRNLKGLFESISGVGGIQIWGNPITMQVRLDREKLKAYNIAVTDIIDTLQENTQEMPSGNIVKGKRHVSIITAAGLNTPQEMGELVISNAKGSVIHLKDISTITLEKDNGEDQWQPRFNDKPAVFIGLRKMTGGNILAISNEVTHIYNKVKETLPPDMILEIGYNFSMFIEASISAVKTTIFEATVLVLLIIFFFLHSPRAAFIPLLTIPVSLIGSFAFLYAFHCSINTITLLAMVLAIGLVVDDAIVVLENIHRHIENGLKPVDAALKGAREVGFAVIAMTLTLATVYAPIAFVQGLTGKLFSEFAVSLSGAVLISGLVALTLSPMMCSKILLPKEKEHHNRFTDWIEGFLAKIDSSYQKALRKALTMPKILTGVLITVLITGGVLFTRIPAELAPQEDEGVVMSWTQGPEGTTLETMSGYTKVVEGMMGNVPEHVGIWSATMRSGVYAGITLKPWSIRKRSQNEIIDELRKQAKGVEGVETFIFPMKGLLSGGQSGLQMGIKTPGTYQAHEQDMDKLVKKLKESPCFENVSHDLYLATPQLTINVDRNKAALLNVKVADIGRTLEVMLSGNRSTTFEKEGRHYDIVIQSDEKHKKDFSDIGNFYVKSEAPKGDKDSEKKDTLVPLNSLITLKEIAIPAELKHLTKMRSSTLNADLSPSCRTDEALVILKAAAKEALPATAQMEPVGHLRKFMESQGEMYLMFLAALLFIYLVLAIQFESLLDPLLIMITVPLSMAGALLALYLTGSTMNIFSQVGLITLVGLITKHGILLVEFANKQRDEGLSVMDAALKAASMRLRPILMTTGAMVLGAVPLAFATGAGASSRQQIGWVLVGGLLGGTFFTLFAVPFVYTFVKGKLSK